MAIYAYIRVSSRDQNEDRQLDAIAPLMLPKSHIFLDKQSGKDFNRPRYRQLMRRIREGDMIVIKSIDRLGRDYQEILEQWKHITRARQVDIRVLDMPLLDTSMSKDLLGTFIADLVLQLLSFVAQNERENIRRRQAEGIAAAKARGVRFGRPRLVDPERFHAVYAQVAKGGLTVQEAARGLGISLTTFYRYAQQQERE